MPPRALFIAVLGSGIVCQGFAQGSAADSLPEVNQRIVAFVRAHLDERVGRGECWDLAAAALDEAHARWDGDYGFGRQLDTRKEAALPGDIVQFEGVEFRWEEGQERNVVRMPHHTAIIYEVSAPGVYTIAQQNTEDTGRKVGLGDLVIARKVKGKVTVYRPLDR